MLNTVESEIIMRAAKKVRAAKEVRAAKKVNSVDQKSKLSSELVKLLKVDDATVLKIAQSEKKLIALKAEKLSSKCKCERQRARNLKFFRHEHTAETIAQLQALASLV